MQDLNKFTQLAYLKSAALGVDSKVFDTNEFAYILTPSSKERWLNAVVRCTVSPDRFHEIKKIVECFREKNINFNWHLWPDSHPELLSFLKKDLKLAYIGKGLFFTKTNMNQNSVNVSGYSIKPLTADLFNSYVQAKVRAWGNGVDQLKEIEAAALYFMKDPKTKTWVLLKENNVVAAVSSFSESKYSYLRGGFVVPEYRGQGMYKQLILHRESELAKANICALTVIADEQTSSPIYKKMGYSEQGEIHILAHLKSRWVSL